MAIISFTLAIDVKFRDSHPDDDKYTLEEFRSMCRDGSFISGS